MEDPILKNFHYCSLIKQVKLDTQMKATLVFTF